jgi:hypothetical protein
MAEVIRMALTKTAIVGSAAAVIIITTTIDNHTYTHSVILREEFFVSQD